MIANIPLNCIEIYTAFDRALLLRIGGLPDLKFQNQAIQCYLFEPCGMKNNRAVGREKELYQSNVYATMHVYYSIN